MSLQNVEEQLPLFLAELQVFSVEVEKQIQLLIAQAERNVPEFSAEHQQQFEKQLTEIEQLASVIAQSRASELAEQLNHKLSLLRTFLYE
ncbi:hypothetical protein [Vibrio hippocampi]|uniref:Uncharacterized protein n=1 Tax=Vibrio hippocampi TaxID=654686 RepID=A0ABM8ZGV1_9VIBR|nr:hypothetical protein [Vibrio hippocampi]CAH0524891.1 hypothetical protein VHP8226_00566 [Vibrio hippocampi]